MIRHFLQVRRCIPKMVWVKWPYSLFTGDLKRTQTKDIINEIRAGEGHSVQVTYKTTCLRVFPHPFFLRDMPRGPESLSLGCRWYYPLNPASLLGLRDPLGCKPSRLGQPSWSHVRQRWGCRKCMDLLWPTKVQAGGESKIRWCLPRSHFHTSFPPCQAALGLAEKNIVIHVHL